MRNTQELYFYWPKIKNALLSLFMLAFAAFGGIVGWFAFDSETYYMSALGAALTIFFSIMAFTGLKRVFSFKPYLILTEEELIIRAASTGTVPLKWEDILGYDIRNVGLNKLIEIKLEDEGIYRKQLPKMAKLINKINGMTNYRPFVVALAQVKRKDRSRLTYELDRRAFVSDESLDEFYALADTYEMEEIDHDRNLIREQMDADKKERQAQSRVNGTYLLKSYGLSLLLTIGAFLLFRMTDDDENADVLVILFAFYPYAKVIWDVLLGFKLRYKMDQDESGVSTLVYRFIFFVQILIYIFGIVLAPIGIIYVISVAVRCRKGRKKASKKHGHGTTNDPEINHKKHAGSKEEAASAAVHVPFVIRFAVFPLHIVLMEAIIYMLIALGMMNIFLLVSLVWYGVTFSVYVALYPGNRGYFLSLIAYLWRIAICLGIQFMMIALTIDDAYKEDSGLILFSIPLFLLPSYIFYLWGRSGFRRLTYHIFDKKQDKVS